jgi:hypothetical protein
MANNLSKAEINPDIYGKDDTSYAESISTRILGVPDPTLDVWGEKDSRAVSEGNHGTQGGGRSGQEEPKSGSEVERPKADQPQHAKSARSGDPDGGQ